MKSIFLILLFFCSTLLHSQINHLRLTPSDAFTNSFKVPLIVDTISNGYAFYDMHSVHVSWNIRCGIIQSIVLKIKCDSIISDDYHLSLKAKCILENIYGNDRIESIEKHIKLFLISRNERGDVNLGSLIPFHIRRIKHSYYIIIP